MQMLNDLYGLNRIKEHKRSNAGYDLPLTFPNELPKEAAEWSFSNSKDVEINYDENTITIKPAGYYSFDAGVSANIPEGYVGLCFPRTSASSIGIDTGYVVVDHGYTGPIHVRAFNTTSHNVTISKPVAQMVVVPYFMDEEDEDFVRGSDWNGSSDAK